LIVADIVDPQIPGVDFAHEHVGFAGHPAEIAKAG
jgi:hypothetical protein